MAERDAPKEGADPRAPQVEEYLKRLGWGYTQRDADLFSLDYPGTRHRFPVRIQLTRDYLCVYVPSVLTVDEKARWAVLEAIYQIHWDSFLPKFEYDTKSRAVRAAWYLPATPEVPPYPLFEQTVYALCDAVERSWDALEEANQQKSDPAMAVHPGLRLREAARLANLGRDLVELAGNLDILPMYVRDDLARQLIALLNSPRRQALLVGEPGTGKNALVYALATWIANDDVRVQNSSMRGCHIYECTPASFQACCFYTSELETKIGMIADNCVREQAIIFLDDANLAVTAGSFTDNPERTIANLLLPVLARNEIVMIAATTPSGHEAMLRVNPAFAESFQVLEVPEPSIEDARRMVGDRLQKLAAGLVGGRKYRFEEGVVDTVMDAASAFIRSRRFPGKALELLNEVVALKGMEAPDSPIKPTDIYACLHRQSHLAEDLAFPERPLTRQRVEASLSDDVLGQPMAIRTVADAVIRFKAEMVSPDRPIASFLFVGPTGVGKTQLAKSLSKFLLGAEDSLVRYDMSEYAGPDGLNKLCGTAGVRETPGRLVSDVIGRRFSVILFDEIEKAHPLVSNALLQVLGEGRMTDEAGRVASFLNSIIILTSNVGGNLYHQQHMGFGGERGGDVARDRVEDALKAYFRAEFLNRLRIVHFAPLSEQIIRQIAEREIDRLAERRGLARRNMRLEVSEALLEQIMRRGYEPRYGARAMQRTVDDLLTAPIADVLAAQPGLRGAFLRADWVDGQVSLRAD
jgi:ATP-dependent Clp protease ATP-binding subunit ClpA